jgi:putative nucleotidyltransferase with HDIG domain
MKNDNRCGLSFTPSTYFQPANRLMPLTEYPVTIDQLIEGVYVKIDSADVSNLFAKTEFKIKSNEEIERIRELGITHVTCVLEKSDNLPLYLNPQDDVLEEVVEIIDETEKKLKTPISAELSSIRRESLDRNQARKSAYRKTEKKFDKTLSDVVQIFRRASGSSSEALEEAEALVKGLAETFLSDNDVTLNVMNDKTGESRGNLHALNVTVLSLMIAKQAGLGPDEFHLLGLSALFHDIGKGRMPMHKVDQTKIHAFNLQADKFYKEHPVAGARRLRDMPDFPTEGVTAVLQHHEAADGSGFPQKLKGEGIVPLARIIHIADSYDSILNDRGLHKAAATPHSTLKHLYGSIRSSFDKNYLVLFIKNLGIYPPGTVVELSNGLQGIVISANTKKADRPEVLVYHRDIPKKEALMLDLTIEEELQIVKDVHPKDLPPEVFSYLSPSKNINYYAEAAAQDG